MSNTTYSLKARNYTVELEVDNNAQCQLYLYNEKKRTRLGVDNLEVILSRLIDSLKKNLSESDSIGEINNERVWWVTSLDEEHTTIYIADKDKNKVLYFQAANTNIIARVELFKEELNSWLKILETVTKA